MFEKANSRVSTVEEETHAYLSTAQASRYLGVSESFLTKGRSYGTVLIPFSKLNRRVVYRRSDLDEYAASNRRCHT